MRAAEGSVPQDTLLGKPATAMCWAGGGRGSEKPKGKRWRTHSPQVPEVHGSAKSYSNSLLEGQNGTSRKAWAWARGLLRKVLAGWGSSGVACSCSLVSLSMNWFLKLLLWSWLQWQQFLFGKHVTVNKLKSNPQPGPHPHLRVKLLQDHRKWDQEVRGKASQECWKALLS